MTAIIAGGARTPIGRLSGGFASLSGAELGGHAISGALDRSGLTPADVANTRTWVELKKLIGK